jgi:hypothetical protein
LANTFGVTALVSYRFALRGVPYWFNDEVPR